jgi:hypothetical protein
MGRYKMRNVCIKQKKVVNPDIDCTNCEVVTKCYTKHKKHVLRKARKMISKKINANYTGSTYDAFAREL